MKFHVILKNRFKNKNTFPISRKYNYYFPNYNQFSFLARNIGKFSYFLKILYAAAFLIRNYNIPLNP